jgi:hypothetical protein
MARADRELSIDDVLSGETVKSNTGMPYTSPGAPPMRFRDPKAHHPEIDITDFDWPSYPDNNDDGKFQTSVWKFSFRDPNTGVIRFWKINQPGSKLTRPNNADIISMEKKFKTLPLEASAGLWYFQKETGGQWIKIDSNRQDPLDWMDCSDEYFESWRKEAWGPNDPFKGVRRPKTDAQIKLEEDRAKDVELERLRAEVAKLRESK